MTALNQSPPRPRKTSRQPSYPRRGATFKALAVAAVCVATSACFPPMDGDMVDPWIEGGGGQAQGGGGQGGEGGQAQGGGGQGGEGGQAQGGAGGSAEGGSAPGGAGGSADSG